LTLCRGFYTPGTCHCQWFYTPGTLRNISYLFVLWMLLLPGACWAQADPEASQVGAAAAPVLANPPPAVGPTTPKVRSKYAVLVDVATGKVLWGRNADTPREVASTTKIMTAILLLERGHLDDKVVGPPGIQSLPESSLHIRTGERIPLRDLLYAMLLRSANDTAVAGANYLCGSVPAFAAQMNLKAKEIGANHTHFVTPNGLYAPNHYSTAADLAKMASYAVTTLPLFNTIVKTQKYKITRSVDTKDVWVRNTASTYLKFFPGADGIKTGYIHQAGHCFVGSATRTDAQGRPWRMIAVALDSPTCREDVMSLLNYGFANYQTTLAVAKDAPVGTVAVAGAASPVPVVAENDLRAVVSRWQPAPQFQIRVAPLPRVSAAPLSAGTKLGVVTVFAMGKPQAIGAAVAARDVPLAPAVAFAKTGKKIGRVALQVLGGLLAAALLTVMGVIIYARAAVRQKQRRKRAAASRAGQSKKPQSALRPARASAKVARSSRSRVTPDV